MENNFINDKVLNTALKSLDLFPCFLELQGTDHNWIVG